MLLPKSGSPIAQRWSFPPSIPPSPARAAKVIVMPKSSRNRSESWHSAHCLIISLAESLKASFRPAGVCRRGSSRKVNYAIWEDTQNSEFICNLSFIFSEWISTFTSADPQKGTCPCDIDLTLIGDWVVDELMFIRREECATAPTGYWDGVFLSWWKFWSLLNFRGWNILWPDRYPDKLANNHIT